MRVELGTLAPIELVQAETRVKTREGDVIVAEAAVREADDKLKAILNVPERHRFLECAPATDGQPLTLRPDVAVAVEEQVDIALRQRPRLPQFAAGYSGAGKFAG